MKHKYLGSSAGITVLIDNPASPTKGLVADITNSYTSGIKVGDCRGAWLADTVAEKVSNPATQPDRSVKNNPLTVYGSLTKAPVAAGAQLVSYSGFSAATYLEQPYSANLDFGTGDFCVMGWAKVVSVADTNKNIFDRSNATTGLVLSIAYSTGLPSIRLSQDGASNVISGANSVALGSYVFLVALRKGVSVELYVDTALVASGASSKNISGDSLVTRIGIDDTLNAGSYACTNTSLALWRIGATAPSADQIAHIYRTELPLFQPGAKCTIDGTSTAVTALDYDEDTELLHVGTSWGRSTFKDLLRVESEATMVGSVTSLSASGGAILTGGTSAKFYQPALSLREELARKDEATAALGSEPAFFDYDAIAGQVAFPLPKGFTIKAVYLAGSLKRLGSTKDYTTSSDGFAETVTFGVAPGAAAWVSIMAVRA